MELSITEGQELMWHDVEVKCGVSTYNFKIYKTSDIIFVYFVDKYGRTLSIASADEMLTLIVNDVDQQRYKKLVGDAKWLLLDGIASQRGMTKDEEMAFLYMKENVLDEMAARLGRL
ncbi:hypothetical protein [Bacillus cereus]|uniref:hypothetical protein n=1 Tax=Bacillus cereus TaxID=1396 RepID=UPI0003023FB3